MSRNKEPAGATANCS